MEVEAKARNSTGEQRRPAKRRRRALPTCAPAKAATTFGLQSPPSPPPPPPPRPPEEEPGGGGGGSQGKEGRGSSSHDAMCTTTAGCVRGPTPADDSGFRLLSFRLALLGEAASELGRRWGCQMGPTGGSFGFVISVWGFEIICGLVGL